MNRADNGPTRPERELDSALVVAGHGRHYVIETPEGVRVHAHPRGKKSDCVVGDRVRWLPTGPVQGVIETIEPRRNLLLRQDEARSKAFAANLDRLLILVAGEPMFSEAQLARALLAARHAGIAATIVLNKVDLESAAVARERLAPYRAMNEDIVELSLKTLPEGAHALLMPRLAGCATLLLGQSGMGKSTLINRFVADAPAQVGELTRALNAGRHTTTTTRWYWLEPQRHTALIDSPGFQEFGLQQIDAATLPVLMPDLARWATECRFYNCTHRHEPGCGVREALARGAIDPSRYRIYEQIHDELTARRW